MGAAERHPLFEKAKELVKKEQYCSGRLLMDNFDIGFNSSGLLIDQLEDAGIVSKFEGSKKRRVLI